MTNGKMMLSTKAKRGSMNIKRATDSIGFGYRRDENGKLPTRVYDLTESEAISNADHLNSLSDDHNQHCSIRLVEDWKDYNWDTSTWPDWVNGVVCETVHWDTGNTKGVSFFYYVVEVE